MTTAGVLGLSPQKRALLEALLRRQGLAEPPAAARIPRRDESGPAPLSFAQQRLWFLDQLEPGGTAYNIPLALRLTGPLDPPTLRRSLEEVVRRHEVLRTSFPAVDGKPVQEVGPAAAFDLPLIDLTGLPGAPREEAWRRLAAAETERPFDLARGPVVRSLLLRLTAAEHLLLLSIHHIAADGWSMDLLLAEIAALYTAFSRREPSPLPELPIQYSDFACWQREWLQGENLSALLATWTKRLQGYSGVLPLPTDRRRPDAQTYRGGYRSLPLTGEELERLRLLATRQGATLFMTLLTAWMTVLSRWAGQSDIGVGVPVANRNRTEIEGLIGLFANTLVLRAEFPGNLDFAAALARVREVNLEAHAHQDLPFEKLVEELQPERSLSLTPLFQVMFVFQGRRKPSPVLAGLEISTLGQAGEAVKNDLVLTAAEGDDRLDLALQFNRDLFEGNTAARMLGHFATLLVAAAAEPERRLADLPLLSPAERRQVVEEWNDTGRAEGRIVGLHQLVEAQAERTPDTVAVVDGDHWLTYGELDRRANLLAHHLRAHGVSAEARVGVHLRRSARLLTTLLAVLKAGGAYLPLDPDYPPERVAFMLEDGAARVVVTGGEPVARSTNLPWVDLDHEDAAIAARPSEPLPPGSTAGNLAYVIYTSGSTGRPKGVAIEHRSAVALLDWALDVYGRDDLAAVLASTSICFDLSVFEIFLPLVAGGSVVVVDNALDLVERPVPLPLSLINTVPSVLAELLRTGTVPDSVRVVNLAGEPLPSALVRDVARLGTVRRLFNLYGPSEDTTYSTWACIDLERQEEPSIGRPVSNTRAYLLDRDLGPVPIGVPGEICLGGAGLARGYLGRPELTAERFVPDPLSGIAGARLYRTGDLGRFRPHGEIEFLGRLDHQVKVRGFRIEPGEIETVLRRHPGVEAAAVVVLEEPGRGRRLGAFVAPGPEASLRVEELRTFLGDRLPSYMVPAAWTLLAALPLTPNGKVDRRALLSLRGGAGAADREHVPPRNAVEEALAAVWAELLRRPRVGADDNFFDLGGDSILSIQMVARAARAGIRLTPRQIFKHQTIAELARVAVSSTGLSADQGLVEGTFLLTPVQRWFFELHAPDPHHFNQALLLGTRGPVDAEALDRALRHLVVHHDALRLRFAGEVFHAPAGDALVLGRIDLAGLPAAHFEKALAFAANQVQASLDLARGPLLRGALLTGGNGEPGRLLLVAHHLVVDGVSWRILLEDLETAYGQVTRGERPCLPLKTTSFKLWAERLRAHAASPAVVAELPWWSSLRDHPVRSLPADLPGGSNLVGSARSVGAELDERDTAGLLQQVPQVYGTGIDDALLSAVALALNGWAGAGPWMIDLEGHGREEIDEELDLSRTVGWFTTIYPVLLDIAPGSGPGEALVKVGDLLRAVPGRGLGYGLLRYLSEDPRASALAVVPRREVSFNYLGQLDTVLSGSRWFQPLGEGAGPTRGPRQERTHILEIVAQVSGGRLRLGCVYSAHLHRRESIATFVEQIVAALRALVEQARSKLADAVPDFPLAHIDPESLRRLWDGGREVEDLYGLSPLQQGLLFHSLYAPDSEVYLEQVAWTVRGELSFEALAEAWRAAALRHPVLRTRFAWKGLEEPVQVVHRHGGPVCERHDWRHLPDEEQRRALAELAAAERRRGFDLERLPLLRLAVVSLSGEAHRCLWTFHHLLLDGWSLPVLLGDVFVLYEAVVHGREARLPDSPPFKEYIAWLRRQDLAAAESFWRRTLAGFTAPTPIPADRPLEPGRSEIWGEVRSHLPALLTERLRALAQEHRLTLNALLQAAWAVLLGRLAGEVDVLFGTTVAGRPASLPGVERMVGLFINTLPVRARLAEAEPLPRWSAGLQDLLSEMRQYEHSPLPQVQRWSQVPGGVPLFESLVVFENYPVESAVRGREAGLRVEDIGVREATSYPLTLALGPGTRLLLKLGHDGRRFEPATAVRLLGHLEALLTDLAAHPSHPLCALSLLSTAEAHQIQAEWNDTATLRPVAPTVVEMFEAQARERPRATALEAGGESLTYEDLDRRAGLLALHLRRLGVGPEARVALAMRRSPELVVAMLAVWKAGGATVPLDLEQPAERLAFLLADSGAEVVLTAHGSTADLPAGGRRIVEIDGAGLDGELTAGGHLPGPAPGDLCYLIYTSGSTGRPKAVMAEHRNLSHVLLASRQALGFDAADRVAAIAAFTFDISLLELWSPLTVGGTSVLLTHRPVFSLSEVVSALDQVTVLHAVPGLLRQVVAELGPAEPGERRYPRLRSILTGGDQVLAELLREVRAALPQVEIRVLYGPTETSIICSSHRVDGSETTSLIGRPLPATRLLLLDPHGGPVPVGVPGEIAVVGGGVTRGYWGLPERTAERYRPSVSGETGGVQYRTGDLARRLPTGELEFLGRTDHQVKVRGFRVEPGEVESALIRHPEVAEAVVVGASDGEGGRRLVAYVVPAPGRHPASEELRAFLSARLPHPLVPGVFVTLEALPLSANGKVDRRALPAPGAERPQLQASFVAPESEAEAALSSIWREVLAIERVGALDNFFDLGGHSLHLMRIHGQVKEAFGLELPMMDLFRYPTVRALAEHLARSGSAAGAALPERPISHADAPEARRGDLRGESRRLTMLNRQGNRRRNVKG